MEFGLCTNFAAPANDPAGISLIAQIAEAGFDYVELPLCAVATLSEQDFETLQAALRENGLAAPAACNLFPDEMVLRGGGEDPARIRAYLDGALARASQLGIRKVIFASVSAWNTTGDPREAREEIAELVRSTVAPVFARYGIRVLMEGIRKQVSNVLNTVPEAAWVAARAAHPSCGVMADLYHMLSNGEPAENLARCLPLVEHVHIAEPDRRLVAADASEELKPLLACLKNGGYAGRISFEVRAPFCREELVQARETVLQLLT